MNIVVYGKKSCVYCTKAREWLAERNLSYTYIDVWDDIDSEELAILKAQYKMKTVPIVVIDDKLIGGYLELTKLAL